MTKTNTLEPTVRLLLVLVQIFTMSLLLSCGSNDKDRAKNIAQKVYKTMNNAITYEQIQNIKLASFPEVEKEYKKGNSYIVPVKGTILKAQGEYEKAYDLYTKEFEKVEIVNNKELSKNILDSLFYLKLYHASVSMSKNKKENNLGKKIVNFYESLYKKNKEKYKSIVPLMLYQVYFCEDKKKSKYWRKVILENNISDIKKISLIENKIKCFKN